MSGLYVLQMKNHIFIFVSILLISSELYGFRYTWPPPNPFCPVDGVVIERVIYESSEHGGLGDGKTIKIFDVAVEKNAEIILSNERIRGGYIWMKRPFNSKTTKAIDFLGKWTTETEASEYLSDMFSAEDLYVSFESLKQRKEQISDASMWFISPTLGLMAYVQVNF